jgi:hypothetical protein
LRWDRPECPAAAPGRDVSHETDRTP